MSDFKKIIYGEEFVKRESELDKRLLEIEKKYEYWFEQRPPKFEKDKHDRLHNHTFMHYDNSMITFAFAKDCDIPEIIMNECLAAFNEVFKH